MFLTDLSIKRPVVASVMSLVLVIFGLVTIQEIPTDELPDVQPPVVTIQTEYKGASAEIVDNQITQKIEDFVGVTILTFALSLTLETPSVITTSPSFSPDITETFPKFLLPISIFIFSAASLLTK